MLRDRPFLVVLALSAGLVALGILGLLIPFHLPELIWLPYFLAGATLVLAALVGSLTLERYSFTGAAVWHNGGLAFLALAAGSLARFLISPDGVGAGAGKIAALLTAEALTSFFFALFLLGFTLRPTRVSPWTAALLTAAVSGFAVLLAGWAVLEAHSSERPELLTAARAGLALAGAACLGAAWSLSRDYLLHRRPIYRYLAAAAAALAVAEFGRVLLPGQYTLAWYALRALSVFPCVFLITGLMREHSGLLRTRQELHRTELLRRISDRALGAVSQEQFLAAVLEEMAAVGITARIRPSPSSSRWSLRQDGEQAGWREITLKAGRDSILEVKPSPEGSFDRSQQQAVGRVVGLGLAHLRAIHELERANGRLRSAYQREQEFVGRLRALSETARTITSSFDSTVVESRVLRELTRSFGARGACLLRLDETGRTLRMQRYLGESKHLMSSLEVPLDEGPLGEVCRTGEAVWLPSLDPQTDVFCRVAGEAGMCCFWGLPLRSRGETLGVLGLFPTLIRDPESADEEREILELLARQVATALKNAQLYEESAQRVLEVTAAVAAERQRAAQLQVLNQLIMGLNSETETGRLLDEALRGGLRLVGALDASIYLMEKGSLRLDAFSSLPELDRPAGLPKILQPKALVNRAILERRVIAQPADTSKDGGDAVCLAAPLLAEGEALGGLVLMGKAGGGGFTPDDQVFAAALAGHVSVALQNLGRLESEQRVTEYLQRNMLPRLARLPGVDFHVVYESAGESRVVGGDFYDLIPLPDGRVASIVGDVCGKGLAAASRTALTRYMMRAYAPFGLKAGDWLSLVNESLQSNLEIGGFVTACLAILNPWTGELEMALAGHPPPLLATNDHVSELRGEPGLPLGAISGLRYATSRYFMDETATLAVFSDGLFEARRGGELFGIARLQASAQSLAALPLLSGAGRLVAEARNWAGGQLVDDLVLILLRRRVADRSGAAPDLESGDQKISLSL